MTKKRTNKFYSNNNGTQKNTDGSSGDDNNNKRLRPSREGLDGGSGASGGNRDGRRDEKRESRNYVPAPSKLSVPEIRQSQQETAITNFSSSELSYNGSDRIVFITNGEQIRTVWKKILRKEKTWDQGKVRIFVSSALVATGNRTGYEVEEIVTELGNPECGLKRLREIINFPSMSCDAGLDRNVLSFQYVILPLLGLFTRTAITECILEKYVHAIFMMVHLNIDSFLYNNVMNMLKTLVQRNSIVDTRVSAETLLSHERYSFIPSSLGVFFLIIVRFLAEMLRRIKEASINETMHKIANNLYLLKAMYQQSLEQQKFSLTDQLTGNLEVRKYFFMVLEREMNTMNKMLNNGRNNLTFGAKRLNVTLDKSNYEELAIGADAERTYDPPGELSKYGRRHNNDFSEISKISIIPTKEEILCDRPPFLPSTLHNSSHFLSDGAARLFDTQFRLLREDLLNPIRSGISNLLTALLQVNTSSNNDDFKLTKELKKIQNKGGRFSYNDGTNRNCDLQVYTNILFADISCDRKRGFACTIKFTPPITSAKDAIGRKEYWERSKKLLVGSLVTLILPNQEPKKVNSNNFTINNNKPTSINDFYSLYFGVIVTRDLKALSKDEHSAEIVINFIDPSIYSIALCEISNFRKGSLEKRFMVESTGVYLEAYYYILKTLQTTDPSSLPFEKYLAPKFDDMNNDEDEKGKMKEGSSSTLDIENPMYTRAPGFQFDLSILCKNKYHLKLNVADKSSYNEVVKNIVKYSNIGKLPDGTPYGLDETQAKALVSSLTREIALVEGPPGTGKTIVGVQIMKVLLARENRKAKIGPILTICFTNHALDQFLEHLLDERITNIVRLGSRTKSERIRGFSLEEICRNRVHNKKESYLLAKLYETIDDIEKNTEKVKNTLFRRWMKWSDLSEYLMIEENIFYNKFVNVTENDLPSWVLATDDNKIKKWPFEKWLSGEDILIIEWRKKSLFNPPKTNKKNNKNNRKNNNNKKKSNNNKSNDNTCEKLNEGTEDKMDIIENELQFDNAMLNWIKNYKEPETDRPLNILIDDHSIWKMSIGEREKLHDHWRTKVYEEAEEKLSDLQKSHDEKRKEIDDIYDERRREILLNSDVIGMTTNGAAKFQNLIRSIGPRIIICEEAGEVLEAHIISALTQFSQHLILIGDHKQLRPHIATYSLSMDSQMGKNYQLDKSLFERLVKGDKAVKIEKTRLLTQRRMRGEISDLIRHTLYPNLIDGDNTTEYENVRGAQHNVYFIDHRNREDNSGREYAVKSHVNIYEVKMVVEMVKYFVRNGYTKPDDIAVLTPYLGQMIKIRDALAKSFVVVIDERDAQNIAEMEEQREQEDDNNVETVSVASKKSLNRQVTLRTVDNFQGEEANIIIVSLVRNYSEFGNKYDSIGFLKSTNRTNVLLSRARKGMYLIGNSKLMAMKSQNMWAPIIKILHERKQVGFGMPIICNRHPDYKNIIVKPDQFERFSPDGGCYKNCNTLLSCGHMCKYKCHSDDPEHIGVKCNDRCLKLHPECNHPCLKLCFENCGDCEFLIGNIILPGCGHELKNAKCWQYRTRDSIKCKTKVPKKLLYCEHYKELYCFESVDNAECTEKCSKQLNCGHECLQKCFECQNLSISTEEPNNEDLEPGELIVSMERTQHGECQTKCQKLLFCGHACRSNCHEGRECPPCKKFCTVTCEHSSCHKPCLEPCAVCAEKCLWECKHKGRCELSCGAPCDRLPCNERCDKELKCGHKCAGVCGETCPSKDFCVICAPEKVKDQISDMICRSTFREIDWNEERMIVLTCRHVFTMETMDMHMEMKDYYEGSIEGGWTSVKILPSSPLYMKMCPTCREPVKNVRRYGRIINKYTLDIQNKKFLTKYSSQLKVISKSIMFLKDKMMRNELKDALPKHEPRPIEIVTKEHNVINKKSSEITPHYYFENIKMHHGFDEISEKAWITHVRKLLDYYQKLTSIINVARLPPHKKAFEAAVSSLYQAKSAKEDSENDSARVQSSSTASSNTSSNFSLSNISSNPSETFKEVLSQVGISIPQVDRRIYLDAFFEIINIQKILHHEIIFIIQELSEESTLYDMVIDNTLSIKEVWKCFIERLQSSIQKHLSTIREVAESTHYGRHLLLAEVEILEFDFKVLQYQLKFAPTDKNGLISRKLQEKITEKCKDIKKRIEIVIESHIFVNSEKEFKNNIHKRLLNLLENCNELEEYAISLSGTLRIEEKLEIHRAMQSEFLGSGHWYECPNGHPYTIGECGGAMVTSRCPDCNETIGGSRHRLTASNRINSEFDTMATMQ